MEMHHWIWNCMFSTAITFNCRHWIWIGNNNSFVDEVDYYTPAVPSMYPAVITVGAELHIVCSNHVSLYSTHRAFADNTKQSISQTS